MQRYILVTGAAGGLGRETVAALAKEGYAVFACDIRPAERAERVIPLPLDVTDAASVDACARAVAEVTDALYAVVNLAGVFWMDTVANGEIAALSRSMEVNFWGAVRVNRAFLPFVQRGSGRIVNMSSELGGYSPQPFNGCYCISKHTLDCYTDTLARELAFVGIPVVKIRAGSFRTGMLHNAGDRFASVARDNTLLGESVGVFSGLVEGELTKTHDPAEFAALMGRILRAKRPRRRYRIRNSAKLACLNLLPEAWQDALYLAVVAWGKRRQRTR